MPDNVSCAAAPNPTLPTQPQPASYGAALVLALRAYLATYQMKSLGRLSAPIVCEIADATLEKWEAAKKKAAKRETPKLTPMPPEKVEALFSLLCELSGIDRRELTNKQQKSDIAIALNEIRRATPAVDYDEIKRRGAAYLKAWPGLKFTALGLSKHWAEFGRPAPKITAPAFWEAECTGWRELLADSAFRDATSFRFCDDWRGLDSAAKIEAWKRAAVARQVGGQTDA